MFHRKIHLIMAVHGHRMYSSCMREIAIGTTYKSKVTCQKCMDTTFFQKGIL